MSQATKAKELGLADLMERFRVPDRTWFVYRSKGGKIVVRGREMTKGELDGNGFVYLSRASGADATSVRQAAAVRFGQQAAR